MRRFIPLVIICLIAIALAVIYTPGLLRVRQFKQTCNAMLTDAKNGDYAKLPNYVAPSDAEALATLTMLVSTTMSDGLQSLSLSSYDKPDNETIWAYVTLKYNGHGTTLIYQGKLRWQYRDGKWVWDLPASYYAPYNGITEGEWRPLRELIAAVEGY